MNIYFYCTYIVIKDERLPGVNPDLKTDGLKTGGERSKKRKSVKKKNEDFAIQYAKSSRSECKGCGEKIIKVILCI